MWGPMTFTCVTLALYIANAAQFLYRGNSCWLSVLDRGGDSDDLCERRIQSVILT
jgi:hypothetical protein